MTKRREVLETTDTVRASRSGHTFHERWAARRALQLVFPKDGLKAIAVEGLSSTETAKPGASAEEVADLVLYFGDGENFATSDTVQTVQFKYKTTSGPVTASYLRKTVEKFAASLVGYAKEFSAIDIDRKLTFAFVTNADFSPDLWEAIQGLRTASPPEGKEALKQHSYLKAICTKAGVDAQKLFSRCEFRASEEALPSQNSNLRRTIVDWSAGADLRATARVFALAELVREKAGLQGQRNNLIRREEVLVALGCEEDDLFPADTRFVDVGEVVARKQLGDARDLISRSDLPVFIHADGGFGKTVFVENLAALMSQSHEVVVFDCFGGGAYRSPDQERHVPSVGFIQIANELASRGLCDPLLPGDTENVALANAVRRRLIQASATIRLQSKKEGILIVLDAADNAQLEADNRKDAAFPQLLLASLNSDPIVGVKLVLTARTHRMGGVIGRSKFAPFLLEAFSSDEAYAFLKSRRKDFSDVDFATAYSRSAGNARVLSYLVETWDTNVADSSLKTTITVEQLIKERCDKIIADLHIAGWPDHEVREFFAAISLLPPPIPLEELATALGWPATQVRSAASDLAPMLEIIPSHGAIFRDEPTETFVHDSYSGEASAQQAIAQRLQDAQTTSSYAAEALPSFLVSIKDSGRAYALADSIGFPSAIQSDFGRRRLTLVRLNAAFKLAVDEDDLDRVLSLTMRLAQVAAANSRGDEFIRRSPSLAVVLGDRDAYRRLFSDRSGWRGARDVRLTIAHAFSAELDEAEIHGSRAIGWINWNARQPRNEHDHTISRSGPDADDFAAVLFLSILRGDFESVDRNLSQWSRSFAISVARSTIKLARQYECALSAELIDPLADFASTERCKSFALKISLLQSASPLSHRQRKAIAQSLRRMAIKPDKPTGYREDLEGDIIEAAFAALVHDGPRSAGHILRAEVAARPSSYDYGERHGYSKAWLPVFRTCAAAWSQKRAVAIHDLLPSNVKVTRKAKAITTYDDLRAFLSRLPAPPRRDGRRVTRRKKTVTRQFDDRECRNISRGIETVLQLTRTLDTTVRTHGKASSLDEFLAAWQALLPKGVTRAFEEPNQVLCRTVGLGFARLLLQHAPNVTQATADKLIEIVSDARFGIRDRLDVLAHLTGKPGLDSRTGKFAQDIASGIRKDDQTDQRGDDYSALADALVTMSVREAQAYYRAGLSELDKLGSGDYDLIYAVLHFAAVKPGGPIRADLGHRLMNLSQTICAHDSGKFGWTLFGRASAKSIGVSAVTKLIRWADQDVAKFSYGLPQLACFLAAENRLKPERAAAFLLLCEDHGWHDWRLGDGLSDLLAVTPDLERRRCIFNVIFRKLKAQHSDGGWPSVWESLLDLGERYPGVVDTFDIEALRGLLADAISKRDEYNSRSFSSERAANIGEPAAERDPEAFLSALLANCDPASASSVDEALAAIESDSTLPYFTKRRLFEKLCETCPYDKRLDHLHALAEASKVPIDNAIDYIEDAVKAWAASSVHIAANIKEVIRSLFRWKGSDLFDLRYGNITRELNQLSTICGDGGFVIRLVLGTISAERVDLDGEEWLQLAAALCHHTSPSSAREALENLLSGPAAGLADEIGEGGYKAEFDVHDEQALLSGVFWHLLGDSDGYVRWAVARSLTTLVELGLVEELSALLVDFHLEVSRVFHREVSHL